MGLTLGSYCPAKEFGGLSTGSKRLGRSSKGLAMVCRSSPRALETRPKRGTDGQNTPLHQVSSLLPIKGEEEG